MLLPQAPDTAAANAASGQATQPEAPTPVWQIELDPTEPLRAVAGPSAIYVSGRESQLRAFAIADGQLLWTAAARKDATPTADDNRLFLISAGAIDALDAADGTVVWSSALPEGEPRSAAGHGVLAVAVETSLFLFEAETGRGLASAALSAPLRVDPVVTDAFVVAVGADGTMTGLDRTSGRRVWTRRLPAPIDAVAASDGRLYASDAEGGLGCFLARNGQMEWRFSLYARASGAPAIDGRHVYVALFDNTVQAIDRISGSRRWYQTLSGRPVTPVWPVGDRLFIVQADGVVMVLASATGERRARLAPEDEARRLEAGGLVPGAAGAAFTMTTGTSTVRRLSLWRPQP